MPPGGGAGTWSVRPCTPAAPPGPAGPPAAEELAAPPAYSWKACREGSTGGGKAGALAAGKGALMPWGFFQTLSRVVRLK
mmetsp:Transcript_432/g.1119  ORF Transcript_432/g.1119 Transcript_432/m.1119 type:complete len:80 (+) Transcript_432:1098-1337(+)